MFKKDSIQVPQIIFKCYFVMSTPYKYLIVWIKHFILLSGMGQIIRNHTCRFYLQHCNLPLAARIASPYVACGCTRNYAVSTRTESVKRGWSFVTYMIISLVRICTLIQMLRSLPPPREAPAPPKGAMTTPGANHAVSLFCLSVFWYWYWL